VRIGAETCPTCSDWAASRNSGARSPTSASPRSPATTPGFFFEWKSSWQPWSKGDSSASATLYRNRVRDLIGFESDRSFCPADPAYDFGCARNIGRARLQGASLAAAHRLGAWTLRANLELLDAKDETTGQRLARRAAHQESVAADHAAGAWSFGVALLDVGARPDAGAQLGAYQTIDLQARGRLSNQWRVEAKLLNAADRRIEPVRDYQGLGRQAWIGLRYSGAGVFGL